MKIKIGKLSIWFLDKSKYDAWKQFDLFAIDYNFYAFEIRPFDWHIAKNHGGVYGHWVLGPLHFWTE